MHLPKAAYNKQLYHPHNSFDKELEQADKENISNRSVIKSFFHP